MELALAPEVLVVDVDHTLFHPALSSPAEQVVMELALAPDVLDVDIQHSTFLLQNGEKISGLHSDEIKIKLMVE